MIQVINIIVSSAMLVMGTNPSVPVPYCLVQAESPQVQAPVVDFYENPEGGCKELGRILQAEWQKQYPNAAVTLVVDAESINRS